MPLAKGRIARMRASASAGDGSPFRSPSALKLPGGGGAQRPLAFQPRKARSSPLPLRLACALALAFLPVLACAGTVLPAFAEQMPLPASLLVSAASSDAGGSEETPADQSADQPAAPGGDQGSGVSGTRAPFVLAGFSAFVVLTGSMEPDIPKGSLVVTRSVDPASLKAGDDITFMVSESTSVTHRIVEVRQTSSGPAFTTQGVSNSRADLNPVAAANVVGKVVYVNAHLGSAVRFVQGYWPLMAFLALVAYGLHRALVRIFAEPAEGSSDPPAAEGVPERSAWAPSRTTRLPDGRRLSELVPHIDAPISNPPARSEGGG